MAETYKRICIEDYLLVAENGDCLELRRGIEYITSKETQGQILVYSSFWVLVPADLFAGELKFT